LGREMPYRIPLPDEYENTAERYPVLYLLHGLFGSFENWDELGGLEATVGAHKLIVVMPEGEDGWYCDGINDGDRYEQYIVRDLIEHCDRNYRTKSEKHCRAIAGNSMGGFGAVKFALKFPQLFDFAYSSSGAFAVTKWNEENQPPQWEEYRNSVTRIFGNKNSRTRSDNDVFDLADTANATNLPEFYFDCGTDDKFREANIALAEQFRKHSISCTLELVSGGHDWDYWSNQLAQIIKITKKRLS
jgi:S-formylglutathione hydrolase FrmB